MLKVKENQMLVIMSASSVDEKAIGKILLNSQFQFNRNLGLINELHET